MTDVERQVHAVWEEQLLRQLNMLFMCTWYSDSYPLWEVAGRPPQEPRFPR